MPLNRKMAAILAAVFLLASLPAPVAEADPNTIAVPALPPVANTDGRFGVVQGIAAPDLALAAGARWDRVIFPWSLIQKDGPESWRELYFSDQVIRAQAARGVTMVGVIIYTPQWASVDPPRGRPLDRPQGLNLAYNDPKNHWGQFVRKLAARHRGVVDHWVVWNEPDLFDPAVRFTFDGSYEEYAQLLKVAYLNIKEANPKAKVILGGMAYWWDKEYGRPPYLGPLLEVIGRDPDHQRHNHFFDIVSVHAYSAPLNSYAEPLIMKEIMELRGLKKPIWISESNVVPLNDPANPLPPGGLRATLDEQASYVIQSMALALAAGVDRYAMYKMMDEHPENGTEMWGLVRNDLSLKPAYVAYQVGSSYFSNVKSAIYSWPGAGEEPTWEQVKRILASNGGRPQFIWPGQVSQVSMERVTHRTTVVWNNSPEPVTHKVPAMAKRATLVTKYGKTDVVNAQDGFYTLNLAPSAHNPDIRDYSIYMIGGDPIIVDEQVAPIPTDRVLSRIETIWPHGGAPVKEAQKANVTAQLLMPGRPGESVPCRYKPTSVQLWANIEGDKKQFVAEGRRRMAVENGIRYPAWDFENVDVSSLRGEENEKKFIEFYVVVDGLQTEAQVWTYGGPTPNDWTKPRERPRANCE